jgi:hypothetical protein
MIRPDAGTGPIGTSSPMAPVRSWPSRFWNDTRTLASTPGGSSLRPDSPATTSDGINAFDYHGLTTEQRLLALGFKRGRRFFPGWDATLVDLPTDVLVSEQRSRQIEGLWLREPKQFLHDALPRARNFLDRFGDIKRRLD